MRSLIAFYLCVFFLCSCEPPVDCTDPKCASSPLSTSLKADLSDSSAVLRLGDTLKLKFRIPDTVITKENLFLVSEIQSAYLSIDFNKIDTIISQSVFTITSESFVLKKGSFSPQSSVIALDKESREAEVHFVLSKKGKFRIQMSRQSQRLTITTKDGKQFLIMSYIGFNVSNRHYDLYLSWIGDLTSRNEEKIRLAGLDEKGIGFYAFKVE